jgi:hypothetical protein
VTKHFITATAITLGIVAGLPWMTAAASGTSGQHIMERIVHRDDRVVIVTTYNTLPWENPDSCDENLKVALVPGDPVLDGEQLATLRAAKMADKTVSFMLDGCFTLDSGISVPKITFITVY